MRYLQHSAALLALSSSINAAVLTRHASADTSFTPEYRTARRSISQTQDSEMQVLSQYAAAAYCYDNTHTPGRYITCETGNCPFVSEAGAWNNEVFSTYANDGDEDMSGFVAIDSTNEIIVVSFRGTANTPNIVADITFDKTSADEICSGCTVHSGFWGLWQASKNWVYQGVENAVAMQPDYDIYVTGHSLGGAVAAIAAASLRNSGYTVAMYSFGAPRIGGSEISQYITSQPGGNYRVTHTADVVPQLPPHDLGWDHISPEYHISTDALPVPPADIDVYEGLYNSSGNSATDLAAALTDPDFDQWVTFMHEHYFSDSISACNSTGPAQDETAVL